MMLPGRTRPALLGQYGSPRFSIWLATRSQSTLSLYPSRRTYSQKVNDETADWNLPPAPYQPANESHTHESSSSDIAEVPANQSTGFASSHESSSPQRAEASLDPQATIQYRPVACSTSSRNLESDSTKPQDRYRSQVNSQVSQGRTRLLRTVRTSKRISAFDPPVKPVMVRTPFKMDQKFAQFTSNLVFRKSDIVQAALEQRKPVVALESTIYTHGFPYPDNVDLALSLESIIRSHGAVPATIGIIDGVAVVGLSRAEIIQLCSSAGRPETMKVSRRDLPYIVGMGLAGKKMNGGTTISGTMVLAQRAGIRVFGTGGLGGVHRGGQDTMDISADLTELGRTPVAVISSGCKSFLDIPRTLEYLETQGVPVITFADGRTGQVDFPSFYTRDSGLKSPMVVQSAREAAGMILARRFMGVLDQGMVLANPIPEEFSIPKEEIDIAINQAVQEAAEQGFHGHANTPFILSRIKDLTKGNSIPANRALIQSNVKMAALVAVELAEMALGYEEAVLAKEEASMEVAANRWTALGVQRRNLGQPVPDVLSASQDTAPVRQQDTSALEQTAPPSPSRPAHILVLGSVALDLSCDYDPHQEGDASEAENDVLPKIHTSNIATISPSVGGVGHNVALAAHLAGGLGSPVKLCSAIGNDLAGKTVLAALRDEGLDTTEIIVDRKTDENNVAPRTAQYIAINDRKKDLLLAMADMKILANQLSLNQTKTMLKTRLQTPDLKWAVIDANWNSFDIRLFMSHYTESFLHTEKEPVRVAFEPVSTAKCAAIFDCKPSDTLALKPFPFNTINLVTPNQHELAALYESAKRHGYFHTDEWWRCIDSLGIPSSGARDRFINITNREMVDEGIPIQTIQLLPFMPTILTKLGKDGVLLTELLKPEDPRLTDPDHAQWILARCTNGSEEVGGVYMRLFPAVETVMNEDVVSVNGVGDTFLGVLVAGLARGLDLDDNLINVAQRGAVMTLKSKRSVCPDVSNLRVVLDDLAKKKFENLPIRRLKTKHGVGY